MRVSEWIAFSYFAYLFIVAISRDGWPDRRRAAATTALLTLCVAALSRLPDAGLVRVLRDWIPGVYLVAGYWVSALFFITPMPAIEAWCLDLDRRIGVDRFIEWAPRVILELLEVAYFACFLFVPACVAIVILADSQLADRAWALVLLGEFGAFGMMPWVQTRPPRALEADSPIERRSPRMRMVNRFMVRHTSIQVNTLPSGHVAGSLTAALALWPVSPWASVVAFLIAAGVTVSAVVGRYHYLIDAITGIVVAAIAWVLVSVIA